MTKWFWHNTTQVGFGVNAVSEHLSKFVQPKSRVLCTFGGGSIDKNGARADVVKALNDLECTVRWEGGIPPNPEYDRLVEIIEVAREFKPDLLLSVGGGSVLDGTKFIAGALTLPQGTDYWTSIMLKGELGEKFIPIGSVMTLPATGSEWNNCSCVSSRKRNAKLAYFHQGSYPTFSLLDPRYTLTLPKRQLANGLFDAMLHCVDQVITGEEVPMFDEFFFSVMRELIRISKPIIEGCADENEKIEYHGRLIQAALFGLNQIFTLAKAPCCAIHGISMPLTVFWGIDHGAALSIVTPIFHELLFESRKRLLARAAEHVFEVSNGSEDEKARAFIAEMRKWINYLGLPTKVSDWEGATVKEGDLEMCVQNVMEASGNKPIGWNGEITEDIVRMVLKPVIN